MFSVLKLFWRRFSTNVLGALGLCSALAVLVLSKKLDWLTAFTVVLVLVPYITSCVNIAASTARQKRKIRIEEARSRAGKRAIQCRQAAAFPDTRTQVAVQPSTTSISAADNRPEDASQLDVELELAVTQLLTSLPSTELVVRRQLTTVSQRRPNLIDACGATQLTQDSQHADWSVQAALLPLPKPMTVVDALNQVAGTGELVTVSYAYGSRAGQLRELAVLSLINSNEAIKARELGETQERTYVVKRIMEVRLQDGTTVRNSETTAAFQDWERERNAYQLHRQNLLDICRFGSDAKLKECRFEVSRTAGGFLLLNKENYQFVTIQARDIEAARRGAYAIEIMLAESEGLWWELQAVLVNNGVYWPAWMQLQSLAYLDGQKIAQEYEKDNPGALWRSVSLKDRSQRYAQSLYWGEEESWQYLEWRQIFEAADVDMTTAFQCMRLPTVDVEEFKAYILSSNGAQKPMSLPYGDISTNTLKWLKRQGLALVAPSPNIRDTLGKYRIIELKALAKSFGLKLTGAKKADLINSCLAAMTTEHQTALLEKNASPVQHVLQPPEGLSWKQFQNFKACNRKMFSMLVHRVDDRLIAKESVKNLLCW